MNFDSGFSLYLWSALKKLEGELEMNLKLIYFTGKTLANPIIEFYRVHDLQKLAKEVAPSESAICKTVHNAQRRRFGLLLKS